MRPTAQAPTGPLARAARCGCAPATAPRLPQWELLPEQAGPLTLRVLVLSSGALVQQLALTVVCHDDLDRDLLSAPASAPAQPEPSVPVGFALSSAAALPAHANALTLTIDQDRAGYRLLLLDGGGVALTCTLALTEHGLADLLAYARSELLAIVYTQVANTYVYQQLDPTIPQANAEQALARLARLGHYLWNGLFSAPGGGRDAEALGERLRARSQAAPLHLTVAAAHLPFPWPLLYDRDPSQAIVADGFWGFRHVLATLPTSGRIGPQNLDLGVGAASGLQALAGLNLTIDQHRGVAPHQLIDGQRRMLASPGIAAQELTTEAALRDALAAGSDAGLLYLFCHMLSALPDQRAVRSGTAPGVGSTRIVLTGPAQALTLRDLQIAAPLSKAPLLRGGPLVIINACGSAELSPLTYDGLVPYLLDQGARAVVGTECETPIFSGAAFGQALIEALVRDKLPVGEALRAARRQFLSSTATRWGCCMRCMAAWICGSAGGEHGTAERRKERNREQRNRERAEESRPTMSDRPDDLRHRIAELEAQLQALRARQTSAPVIDSPHSGRDINIATHQSITYQIHGPDPDAAQREQIDHYLRRLAARMQRLPLRGLAAQLDDGPGIALPQVYVMLATKGRVELASDAAGSTTPVEQFYQQGDREQPLRPEYDPDYALPDSAIVAAEPIILPGRREQETDGRALYRALLAAEAVVRSPRLVLLGEPGGGKSTFLRHLAWALAQRGLGQPEASPLGWPEDLALLPLLLPLRSLALRIAAEGAAPASVSAAIRDELAREYDLRQADALLDRALAGGHVLLLLDGLDELPTEPAPGIADRLATLRALRDFAELHAGLRVVLTCRSRVFDVRLRGALGWPVETLAPLTLGQVRRFVADWYAALAKRGVFSAEQAGAQAQTLAETIAASTRLRALAENPLLLTMMALVLAEQGDLPRDRPLLYERILEQLLGRWDQQKGGQSLAEAIGAGDLRSADLRATLDLLCFQAHTSTSAGPGRLLAGELRYALASFFEQVRVDGAWEAAGLCLAYFDQRGGLLLPSDDGDAYTFAHLTLQEYGAGRHLLLQPNAAELVLRRRAEARWREPIALGLGVVQRFYPMLADRIERVLAELIDGDEHGRPKPRARWYRDLILAAELGAERDWNSLRALINVDRLQRELRLGLVALLADAAQPLPVVERVRAGFLLGELGDPRFPVSLDQWRQAIERARAGQANGYFCPIPAPAGAAPRWIGRYPITNAQLNAWAATAQPRRADRSRMPTSTGRTSQPLA